MINRRPYIAESVIKPGRGVVQGSADNKVKSPVDGEGDFIGVYPYESNEDKAAGEAIGIVLHGVVKVEAGGTVAAGKKVVFKDDDSGRFVVLPEDEGQHTTCGTFLEGGSAGDYVDMIVERGSVTISD